MDESKLGVEIREAGNGWLVAFTKWDETAEFVFSRPGPAAVSYTHLTLPTILLV